MLLFLDQPGMYNTTLLPAWWKGGYDSSHVTIVNTPLPPNSQSGAQAISIGVVSEGSWVQSNNYGSNARLIAGTRYYRSNSAGAGVIMAFLNSTGVGTLDTVFQLMQDSSGTYLYARGVLVATGPVVPPLQYNHYELDVTFSTTGGASATLYLNGSETPFIPTVSGFSTTAASAQILQLGYNAPGGYTLNAAGGYYADTYLMNGVTGPGGITFTKALAPQGLGAAKTGFAVPNGVGAVSTWTASGAATIWQAISPIPASGDTSYASDSTSGDAFMCTFGALPAMQTLIAVQLSVYAREDDSAPRAYQSGFYNGGTYGYSGVNQYLGSNYGYAFDEYELNPITASAWAPSSLTGMQFGAKVSV